MFTKRKYIVSCHSDLNRIADYPIIVFFIDLRIRKTPMPLLKNSRRLWIIGLAVLASALPWPVVATASGNPFPDTLKTIVLDPGHGGNDNGAHGPTGSLEKDICLNLTRELADQMNYGYQVFLARSDDYSVNLRHRTAAANHNQADVFISIHCGAGFLHTATGMTVYYWKPGSPQPASQAGQDAANPNRWDQTQRPHLAASHRFAQDMQEALEAVAGDGNVQLRQAPLVVLQGAAMPAILIEIGHITHPATEKNLLSSQWRQRLARAIHTGVELYLENQQIDQ